MKDGEPHESEDAFTILTEACDAALLAANEGVEQEVWTAVTVAFELLKDAEDVRRELAAQIIDAFERAQQSSCGVFVNMRTSPPTAEASCLVRPGHLIVCAATGDGPADWATVTWVNP